MFRLNYSNVTTEEAPSIAHPNFRISTKPRTETSSRRPSGQLPTRPMILAMVICLLIRTGQGAASSEPSDSQYAKDSLLTSGGLQSRIVKEPTDAECEKYSRLTVGDPQAKCKKDSLLTANDTQSHNDPIDTECDKDHLLTAGDPQSLCPTCSGKGWVDLFDIENCKSCNGSGVVNEPKSSESAIPIVTHSITNSAAISTADAATEPAADTATIATAQSTAKPTADTAAFATTESATYSTAHTATDSQKAEVFTSPEEVAKLLNDDVADGVENLAETVWRILETCNIQPPRPCDPPVEKHTSAMDSFPSPKIPTTTAVDAVELAK